MKKYLLVLSMVFVVSVPVFLFAQTEKELEQAREWLGTWKRNFAAPSYGIALFRGELRGGYYGQPLTIPDEERGFPATAMDFRIFRGVNVSKRGGFYTGVEAGVLFLSPFADVSFYEPTLDENMYLNYTGGLVFLMAKYGLRLDIGLAIFGVSLGMEMGMGGTLFAGGFNLYTGSRDNKTADVGWGASAATLGLIMDLSAEAALRLGKNLRLFTKLGVMAAPISVPEQERGRDYWYDGTNWYYTWDTGYYNGEIWIPPTPITDPREKGRAVMSQYDVEIDPFCLDLRVGFALNFEI